MSKRKTPGTDLPQYMRNLLLSETGRRINIIKYCNHFFKLELKQVKRAACKGTCPWCGEKESLLFYRMNGTFTCECCGIKADFFDIVTKHWDLGLDFTLKLLAWQLEKAEAFIQGGSL